MADIEWVKLATDFMSNSKIRHIRTQKNGDTMALLWVMLLCRAGIINDRGKVYVAPGVPYSNAGLAAEFGMTKKTVADALKLFEQLGMVRLVEGGLEIVNWCEYQNVEGMERVRDGTPPPSAPNNDTSREAARARSRETSRRYRDKQKGARDSSGDTPVTVGDTSESVTRDTMVTPAGCHGDSDGDTPVTVTVTAGDSAESVTVTPRDSESDRPVRDKEIDGEKEKDQETEEDAVEPTETDYQKALGIDDEYKESSRARAASASLVKEQIKAEKLLEGHLPKLFDVIEGAMEMGFTVNGIMVEARECNGSWSRFASALMSGKPH